MTIKDIINSLFAKKQQANTPQSLTIVDRTVTIAQIERGKIDIRKWRDALESAENIYYPDRQQLITIYNELIIDAYISEAMKKRVRHVRNTPAVVFDKNGERNVEKTALLQTVWWQNFCEYVVDSEFWGFSLMELVVKNSSISDCVLIPRNMVSPEFGRVFTYSPTDTTGVSFYEKPYLNYLLFAGEARNLGLLNKLAPYAIYKRGTISDWAEHSELYGMPIRTYTYDPNQPNARNEAEQSAKSAGSAAYVVLPKGTELILAGGDGTSKPEMYEVFRQALNSEMVIAILGQTMTTEAGSSRSQGEVHERSEEDIFKDDLVRVQIFANTNLVPRLVSFGILAEGDTIGFDKSEKLSIEAQFAMDLQLCEKIDVPQSYLYEKYNIPYPTGKEPIAYRQSNAKTAAVALSDSKKKLDFEEFALKDNTLPTLDSFVLETVFEMFADDFLEALDKGIVPEMSKDMEASLRSNTLEFAAAKSIILEKAFSQSQEAGNAKYLELRGYNQTERDLFTAGAQMAYKWEQTIANKDTLPYLQFDALNDKRVRPEHAALDGIVRRYDDKFWLTHYPPMGYNCRCTVRNIAGGENETSAKELDVRIEKDGGKPDQGFGYNVGITREIIGKELSYFAQLTKKELEKTKELAKTYKP